MSGMGGGRDVRDYHCPVQIGVKGALGNEERQSPNMRGMRGRGNDNDDRRRRRNFQLFTYRAQKYSESVQRKRSVPKRQDLIVSS
jgi:hypothetical protein